MRIVGVAALALLPLCLPFSARSAPDPCRGRPTAPMEPTVDVRDEGDARTVTRRFSAPVCADPGPWLTVERWSSATHRLLAATAALDGVPLPAAAIRDVPDVLGPVGIFTAARKIDVALPPDAPGRTLTVELRYAVTARFLSDTTGALCAGWYATAARAGPALRTAFAAFRARAAGGGDVVAAALRFTAERVRYIETGGEAALSGIAPRAADETFALGHGVCRDKVAVVTALLRAAGLEADPVLVRASPLPPGDAAAGLDFPYDHVIVRVGGAVRPRLIDPTDDDADRKGPPAHLHGRAALVCASGAVPAPLHIDAAPARADVPTTLYEGLRGPRERYTVRAGAGAVVTFGRPAVLTRVGEGRVLWAPDVTPGPEVPEWRDFRAGGLSRPLTIRQDIALPPGAALVHATQAAVAGLRLTYDARGRTIVLEPVPRAQQITARRALDGAVGAGIVVAMRPGAPAAGRTLDEAAEGPPSLPRVPALLCDGPAAVPPAALRRTIGAGGRLVERYELAAEGGALVLTFDAVFAGARGGALFVPVPDVTGAPVIERFESADDASAPRAADPAALRAAVSPAGVLVVPPRLGGGRFVRLRMTVRLAADAVLSVPFAEFVGAERAALVCVAARAPARLGLDRDLTLAGARVAVRDDVTRLTLAAPPEGTSIALAGPPAALVPPTWAPVAGDAQAPKAVDLERAVAAVARTVRVGWAPVPWFVTPQAWFARVATLLPGVRPVYVGGRRTNPVDGAEFAAPGAWAAAVGRAGADVVRTPPGAVLFAPGEDPLPDRPLLLTFFDGPRGARSDVRPPESLWNTMDAGARRARIEIVVGAGAPTVTLRLNDGAGPADASRVFAGAPDEATWDFTRDANTGERVQVFRPAVPAAGAVRRFGVPVGVLFDGRPRSDDRVTLAIVAEPGFVLHGALDDERPPAHVTVDADTPYRRMVSWGPAADAGTRSLDRTAPPCGLFVAAWSAEAR